MTRPRCIALAGLLLAAAALALPSTASADPCPDGLTVAGVPVTGADCIDRGNGEVEIDHPRLLSTQAVEIRGRMILNVDRTQLRQETTLVPLVLAIFNAQGISQPLLAGTLEVGTFEICDLFGSQPDVGGTTSLALNDDSGAVTNDRLDVQSAQANCRQAPAINVTQPALQAAVKLLKLAVEISPIFVSDQGAAVALPTTFGIDEARGGRIFGNFVAQVPLVGSSNHLRFGLTAEMSRDEGFKPVSVGGAYAGRVAVLPGVSIHDPAFLIDPVNERYGGRLRLSFPPRLMAGGAEVLVEQGSLKRIGFDIGLPPPGLPVGAPPLVTFQSFGVTFIRGTKTQSGPLGRTTTVPATFQGRTSFSAGPLVPTPAGNFSALVGDVDVTIQGPTVQLLGTLTGINRLITLGQARVLVGASPFRFEADASLAFPSQTNAVVLGTVFVGVTGSAFTGLGTFSIQLPPAVPIIGGQKLGGFSGVVSNKAVGGVIVVDPPLFDPRSVGVAFKYGAGFSVIDSITPFITVTPTRTLTASAAAAGAARRVTFRNRRTRRAVAIEIRGRGGKRPRGVTVRRRGGKRLRTVKLPSGAPSTVTLGVRRLPRGRYTVTGRGIAKVLVARIAPTPYLDPAPGFGARPRPPVSAGTPVDVCWDVEHAPKGTAVDLFEDTNGFAATGRDIASGLAAKGCHRISTAGWEPGRHWVYGLVRRGDTPLSTRYWPIGIEIFDPGRLPAPGRLTATPTHDGAVVRWDRVEGASGYQVIAEPVDPQDAPSATTIALQSDSPSAELSLRGAAAWFIRVQAVDFAGALGNLSAPVQTGATAPVVLAGTPNGTPQVGRQWAFKLETANVANLKVLAAPPGTKLDPAAGLLTWTPSRAAARSAPQPLKVEGCAGDGRCFAQEWTLPAFAPGITPAGPARGFEVLDSVVKPGQRIRLRAQGIDEKITAKVDGKVVGSRILDEQTVAIVLPDTLRPGAHDVSLRIGQDLEETLSGAIVVL